MEKRKRDQTPLTPWSGKTLLVFGGSGFVGKVWLSSFLSYSRDFERVYLPLRAQSREAARARFIEILKTSPAFAPVRESLGKNFLERTLERVIPIQGDLSLKDLGIPTATRKTLTKNVDVVLNIAALTEFNPNVSLAFETNLRGALRIADLAAECRGRKLVHVSTVYVCGNQSGPIAEALPRGKSPSGRRFSAEKEFEWLAAHADSRNTAEVLVRARALGWPNIYTYTKGLAEHLMSAKSDVQITIVRPSIVEAAVAYPFPGWTEGFSRGAPIIHGLGGLNRGLFCNGEGVIDVIPVDVVARSLTAVLAGALDGVSPAVYQIATSHLRPLPYRHVLKITEAAYRRIASESGRNLAKRFRGSARRLLPSYTFGTGSLLYRLPKDVNRAAKQSTAVITQLQTKFVRARWMPTPMKARVQKGMGKTLDVLDAIAQLSKFRARLHELYRPFLHDNDPVFLATRIGQLERKLRTLPPSPLPTIDDIEWEDYFSRALVPGILKWSPIPERIRR